MLNYWWVTRPKRKLDSIPEILTCCYRVTKECEWQGNIYTHLAFEKALEEDGLKRPGERKDQRGGGGRTYYAWLFSLGLVFTEEKTGQTRLTLAGEAIVSGKNPVETLSNQVIKYQIPSPFSLSPNSSKTRVTNRFSIRPFRFILKLLLDERLEGYITQEELARVIAVEANDESQQTYEYVVERILAYREDGISSLSETFFSDYAPSTGKVNIMHPYSHLDDLANTLINWLEYTQLIARSSGAFSLAPDKIDTVNNILNDGSIIIDKPECQESFQRRYGLDLYSSEDVRTFERQDKE